MKNQIQLDDYQTTTNIYTKIQPEQLLTKVLYALMHSHKQGILDVYVKWKNSLTLKTIDYYSIGKLESQLDKDTIECVYYNLPLERDDCQRPSEKSTSLNEDYRLSNYHDIVVQLYNSTPIGKFRLITYNAGIIQHTIDMTEDNDVTTVEALFNMGHACFGVKDRGIHGTTAEIISDVGLTVDDYTKVYVFYKEEDYNQRDSKKLNAEDESRIAEKIFKHAHSTIIVHRPSTLALNKLLGTARKLDQVQVDIGTHDFLYEARNEIQDIIEILEEPIGMEPGIVYVTPSGANGSKTSPNTIHRPEVNDLIKKENIKQPKHGDQIDPDLKTVWDLKMHEDMTIRNNFFAIRVPGGWIYELYDANANQATTTFVPYVDQIHNTGCTLCGNSVDKTAQTILEVLNHLNDEQATIDSDGDLLEYIKKYLSYEEEAWSLR